MASVPKLLLLLLCSYHTFVAHAGGDRSYKILSIGSLNSDSVCSQPKGAALSEHAMRDFIWLFLCAVVIVSPALIVSATPSSIGVTVPLHHRHGPCSPAPSKKVPALEEMLRRDQLRADQWRI